MYINSYKDISSNNSELPDLGNNSLDQIQVIEAIKNFLKTSAEEFEAKQSIKKTKLVSLTPVSNLFYLTDILTNDISYIEQEKNSSSNTNEVSEIIDKEIEFLCAQRSSIKDDKFQKIIEELFPCELINKEMTIESQICNPVVLSSNVDQETHLQSLPSTDILSLSWSIAVLSSDNNLESQEKQSNTGFTNDVSSSHRTRKINQKISEAMKRNWKNPEFRKMRVEAMKRRWEDPEYRRKVSEALKGRRITAGDVSSSHGTREINQKISEAMKRNWKNPEFRKMRTKIMKQYWADPEHRRKVSEALKGRCITPETRQKLSEARKGRRITPETRQKLSEARKRRRITPETLIKQLNLY